MDKTRLQDIYLQLKSNAIDVYFPGQAVGDVLSPRTVVKCNGSAKVGDVSTTQDLYDVMCYVPQNQYSQVETYKTEVKRIMGLMKPTIMPTFIETESYYDDTIKGHMVSIMYRNYKKII